MKLILICLLGIHSASAGFEGFFGHLFANLPGGSPIFFNLGTPRGSTSIIPAPNPMPPDGHKVWGLGDRSAYRINQFAASNDLPTLEQIYAEALKDLNEVQEIHNREFASGYDPYKCRESQQKLLAQSRGHLDYMNKTLLSRRKALAPPPPPAAPVAVIPPPAPPPPEPICEPSTPGYTFISAPGEFRSSLIKQYNELNQHTFCYEGQPPKKALAQRYGLISTMKADESYSAQEYAHAEFYKDLGKGFLDIVVGLDPVTGLGRSAYELITGTNLITGHNLSDTERTISFLGVITAGNGRFISNAGSAITKIVQSKAIKGLINPRAVKHAIETGETIVKASPEVFTHWSKKHVITHIEEARAANTRMNYLDHPPYKDGSYVVHFKTTESQNFVRVHNNGLTSHPEGRWVVRHGEIKGLNSDQIRNKLNLRDLPSHISDVYVPINTKMSRGITHLNHWDLPLSSPMGGQVQYRIEQAIDPKWFINTRPL